MTKHKNPEDRINEILHAAAEITVEEGLSGLTMDAIALRTGLSKGGVYRFFANKKEVIQMMYERIYSSFAAFDPQKLLSWNLSFEQTMVRLLLRDPWEAPNSFGSFRLWLHLIPEMAINEDLRKIKQKYIGITKQHLADLVLMLLERDNLSLNEKGQASLMHAITISDFLLSGLFIEYVSGKSAEELTEQVTWFMHEITKDSIVPKPAD